MELKQIKENVTKYRLLKREVNTINDLILIAKKEIMDEKWKKRMNKKIELLEEMLMKYDEMDESRRVVYELLEESFSIIKKELIEKMRYVEEYNFFEKKLEEIKSLKDKEQIKLIGL